MLLVSLLSAGTALAARGDPEKKITPADQARARAMLLRKSDFGPVFRASKAVDTESDFYCPALDESDLTLTGEAQSQTFAGGVEAYTSASQVYETKADSSASWGRGTSAAGEQCARREFSRLLARQATRLESFGRVPFPRLAEKSVAYRLVISSQGIRAFLDVVALKQGRAQVSVLLTSGLTPVPKTEQVRLARLVAGRMQTAMRGG